MRAVAAASSSRMQPGALYEPSISPECVRLHGKSAQGRDERIQQLLRSLQLGSAAQVPPEAIEPASPVASESSMSSSSELSPMAKEPSPKAPRQPLRPAPSQPRVPPTAAEPCKSSTPAPAPEVVAAPAGRSGSTAAPRDCASPRASALESSIDLFLYAEELVADEKQTPRRLGAKLAQADEQRTRRQAGRRKPAPVGRPSAGALRLDRQEREITEAERKLQMSIDRLDAALLSRMASRHDDGTQSAPVGNAPPASRCVSRLRAATASASGRPVDTGGAALAVPCKRHGLLPCALCAAAARLPPRPKPKPPPARRAPGLAPPAPRRARSAGPGYATLNTARQRHAESRPAPHMQRRPSLPAVHAAAPPMPRPLPSIQVPPSQLASIGALAELQSPTFEPAPFQPPASLPPPQPSQPPPSQPPPPPPQEPSPPSQPMPQCAAPAFASHPPPIPLPPPPMLAQHAMQQQQQYYGMPPFNPAMYWAPPPAASAQPELPGYAPLPPAPHACSPIAELTAESQPSPTPGAAEAGRIFAAPNARDVLFGA